MEDVLLLGGAAMKRLVTYLRHIFGTKWKAAELASASSAVTRRLEKVRRGLVDLNGIVAEPAETAQLGKIEQSVLDLYSSIKPPVIQGTLEDRFKTYEKEGKALETLAKLVTPLEAASATIGTKHTADELSALNDYVSLVKVTYTESQTQHVDLVGRLRGFEEKHRGVSVTSFVRRYRTSLPRGPDPEVLNYFEAVYSKVSGNPPQLSPTAKSELGSKGSWHINFARSKPKLAAQYGRIRPKVMLNCDYAKSNTLPHQKKPKSAFTINCIVKNSPSEELTDLAKKFAGTNSVLYFYDAKNSALHYNTNNVMAELFSGYFEPEKLMPPTYATSLDMILTKAKGRNEIITALGAPQLKRLLNKGTVMMDFEGEDLVYAKNHAEL